jgi:hypothetical protein
VNLRLALALESLTDNLAAIGQSKREAPCGETLDGISPRAIVACAGEQVDIPDWTCVTVPDGWIALNPRRADVRRAMGRFGLTVVGRHQPVVSLAEMRFRHDLGIARLLVSSCPAQTANRLVTAMDRGATEFTTEGKRFERSTLEIGRRQVERFVLVFDSAPTFPPMLLAVWAVQSTRLSYIVQAEFPALYPGDEDTVDTILGSCEIRARGRMRKRVHPGAA